MNRRQALKTFVAMAVAPALPAPIRLIEAWDPPSHPVLFFGDRTVWWISKAGDSLIKAVVAGMESRAWHVGPTEVWDLFIGGADADSAEVPGVDGSEDRFPVAGSSAEEGL